MLHEDAHCQFRRDKKICYCETKTRKQNSYPLEMWMMKILLIEIKTYSDLGITMIDIEKEYLFVNRCYIPKILEPNDGER